ncbi:MAG: hypothetical protein ABI791_08565 [Acidobacteriota bacterium]
MFLSLRSTIIPVFLLGAMSIAAAGQTVTGDTKAPSKTVEKKDPATTDENKVPKAPKSSSKDTAKPVTAEQVAESAILVYAFPGGRVTLDQIRKTAVESGKTSVMNADGKVDQANYHRWTMRGASQSKEKIRLDQEFPTARYALVFNDEKVFGIYNDAVFTPRDDATRAFQNQIAYSIDSLLRYKENESKLELAGREKHMGVEYFVVDVTDKQSHKIRFYVSVKTFRVMMLEYEDEGIKYKRKYYNYNYAQGTLVPYRTVLYANDKIVEETEIGTVTYGQKVDEGMFSAG